MISLAQKLKNLLEKIDKDSAFFHKQLVDTHDNVVDVKKSVFSSSAALKKHGWNDHASMMKGTFVVTHTHPDYPNHKIHVTSEGVFPEVNGKVQGKITHEDAPDFIEKLYKEAVKVK